MEEKFKIIFNLKDEMFNIFKKSFEKEGYEIICKDENIVFIKKSEKELTAKQIAIILGMVRIHKKSTKGIIFMDITSAVQYLMKIPEEKANKDGQFRWMMRQAYTKAIVEKNKGEM